MRLYPVQFFTLNLNNSDKTKKSVVESDRANQAKLTNMQGDKGVLN